VARSSSPQTSPSASALIREESIHSLWNGNTPVCVTVSGPFRLFLVMETKSLPDPSMGLRKSSIGLPHATQRGFGTTRRLPLLAAAEVDSIKNDLRRSSIKSQNGRSPGSSSSFTLAMLAHGGGRESLPQNTGSGRISRMDWPCCTRLTVAGRWAVRSDFQHALVWTVQPWPTV
jgi:hypothetical protein